MALMKKAKPADAIEAPPVQGEEAAAEDEVEAAQDSDVEESPEQAAADAETMAALAAVPADPVEAEAGGTDALLDMFTAVGIEAVDRTLLVGMAGEVEMGDLVSELNVVAAALGVIRSRNEARLEQAEEPLAA